MLGALYSLQSKKMLSVEKRRGTNILSNKEKKKWIKDYVDREIRVARMRVQYVVSAMMEVLEHMRHVEKA